MNAINSFIKKINQNSPLKHNGDVELINYRYPYKPILIMSLIYSVHIDDLFNKEILWSFNE